MYKKFLLALMLSNLIFLQGCVGLFAAGVVSTGVAANDDRRISAQVNDAEIELDVFNATSTDQSLSTSHITGVSMNGSVLLVGQVPDEVAAKKLDELMSKIKYPGTLFNQVKIMPITSIATRTNDTWITTKVKSRLLAIKGLDSTKVKVLTENSEVFLLGLVSKNQGKIAAFEASKIKGITRVVKLFEYTDTDI